MDPQAMAIIQQAKVTMRQMLVNPSSNAPLQMFGDNSVLQHTRLRLTDLATAPSMAVKDLNLSERYCEANSAWNEHTSLRELVQNWRDQVIHGLQAEESNLEIRTELLPHRRLFAAYLRGSETCGGFISEEITSNGTSAICLVNYGTRLGDEALVIGASSKIGSSRMAGAHGEGMKVGVNRLLSRGCRVGIITRGEEWIFAHHQSTLWLARFPVQQDLAQIFPNCRDTTVIIVSGFPGQLRTEDYLFLSSAEERIMRESQSWSDNDTRFAPRFLFEPKYAGKVFVKGIYVCESAGISIGDKAVDSLGIDIRNGFQLSRDRDCVTDRQIAEAIYLSLENVGTQWRRLPTAPIPGTVVQLVDLLYRALEKSDGGGNVFSIVAQHVRLKDGLSYLIFRYMLHKVTDGRIPDDLTADFLTLQNTPYLLPVRKGTGKEETEDFEYFLGLPNERIVKSSEALLRVLLAFQPHRGITAYIQQFWGQLVGMADFDWSNNAQLRQWIREQVKTTFQGILTMDHFLFKTFPDVGSNVSVNRKPVRVIKNVSHKGQSFAVVVDCKALFSCCICVVGTKGTCRNNCFRSEFLSSLKDSLFREFPGYRSLHEKQAQDYLISLTGANNIGDQIPFNTQPVPRTASPGLSSPLNDDSIVPQASGLSSASVSTPMPVSFHSGVSDGATTTFEDFHSNVPRSLSPFFRAVQTAEPIPMIQAEQFNEESQSDPGCPAIDLELVSDWNGFNIYVGGDLLRSDPKLRQLDRLLHYYRGEIEILQRTLTTLFARIMCVDPNISVASNKNIFVSGDPSLIAFNRNGLVYYHARMSPRLPGTQEIDLESMMSFWLVTICHEAAHNLFHGHGKQHEAMMEQLLTKLIPSVGVSQGGFQSAAYLT